MTQYRMQFQPIYESISFIEHYINHENDYQGVDRFCKNEQEKETVELLKKVCNLIGEAFLKRYPDQEFLFTYLDKQKSTSPMKAILFGKCDFQTVDYTVQIQTLETYYSQNPMKLLNEFLESEKGQPVEEDMNMSQYMLAINELLLSDEVKWKLWSLQNEIPQIFQVLKDAVEISNSIIEKYPSLYEKFLSFYQEELSLVGDQDFYAALTKAIGYFVNTNETYVFPSVAACKTVSFIDQKKGKDFVLYGIGTYRRLCEETVISDEDLCSALKLMGDKSKFDILRFIANKKAYGAQIAQELKLSTPTISYHMQALLCAQLVTYEKSNNKLYYGLNKEYIKSFLKQVSERLLEE